MRAGGNGGVPAPVDGTAGKWSGAAAETIRGDEFVDSACMGLFDPCSTTARTRWADLSRPFLQETTDMDIYRYLVMSIVVAVTTSCSTICRLHTQSSGALSAILLEAATILAHRPEFAELAEHLRRPVK